VMSSAFEAEAEDSRGARLEKLGGNADGCEKKGVAEKATQKMLKTKELEIDCLRKTHGVAVEGAKRGHCQQNLDSKVTASVTICQVRN